MSAYYSVLSNGSNDTLSWKTGNANVDDTSIVFYISTLDVTAQKNLYVRVYGYSRLNPVQADGYVFEISDTVGLTIGGWGINATVREYAKFGYLYLKKGKWEDHQVVSSDWIERSTRPIASTINYYGLHWWLIDGFTGFEESGLPEGIYVAMGLHGQLLYVIPGSNIVIVKTANTTDPLHSDWDHIYFLSLVMDSV